MVFLESLHYLFLGLKAVPVLVDQVAHRRLGAEWVLGYPYHFPWVAVLLLFQELLLAFRFLLLDEFLQSLGLLLVHLGARRPGGSHLFVHLCVPPLLAAYRGQLRSAVFGEECKERIVCFVV